MTHLALRAPVRRPGVFVLTILAIVLAGCGSDVPERPGGVLVNDGTNPVITDPQGVGNELTDLSD